VRLGLGCDDHDLRPVAAGWAPPPSARIAVIQVSIAVPLLFSGFLVNAAGPRVVYAAAGALAACGTVALAVMMRRVRRAGV
jgi:hypothetical protein